MADTPAISNSARFWPAAASPPWVETCAAPSWAAAMVVCSAWYQRANCTRTTRRNSSSGSTRRSSRVAWPLSLAVSSCMTALTSLVQRIDVLDHTAGERRHRTREGLEDRQEGDHTDRQQQDVFDDGHPCVLTD